nr:BlaI/MecI/CopY family transcriptional regulator [Oscillospiraceae bacterium]
MADVRLGMVEAHFADIVWEAAPLTTRELVRLCAEELNWARTTTYTVLRKLCEKGIFKMENSMVTVVIPKKEFAAMQSEQFVEQTFQGSLPAFVAAFTSRKKISRKEMEEIKELLNAFEEA